ncbi:MAG TPA: pyrroloquinoline quinone biosynthesis peptide chaperone PqqD [Casimicrobiaceae bacterium]
MSAEPIAPDAVPRLSPRFRLQFEVAQSAWVLLYPEGMVKLSHSAAAILERIDGRTSAEALVRRLQEAFPGADLRGDVLEFLRLADERGWIVF